MSNYSAIIRKGEIFVKRWNPEIRDYEEKKKTEQVLSDILQFPLVIEDTTFGQFFNLIAKEKDLYEKVFKAAMYGHPIEPYIQEVGKPDGAPEGLEYVEVFWGAEVFEGKLELYPGFHGYGKWKNTFNDPDMPEKGGIAIEYSGLNEYKMMPLKLDTNVEFYDAGDSFKKVMQAELPFKVYDVINAILFEITWAGDISKGRKGCPGCEVEQGEQAA